MDASTVTRGYIYGGVASCLSEAVMHPMDVVKVRMQLQGEHNVVICLLFVCFASFFSPSCLDYQTIEPSSLLTYHLQRQYKNTFHAFSRIWKTEGPIALYKGFKPAVLRQATYGTFRIGLYAPMKRFFGVHDETAAQGQQMDGE